MPKPTYEELWNKAKNLEKENQGLKQAVAELRSDQQAEQALQESESKFRSVTEQSPNMIFINKHGKIVYCNKRCEKIMGYSQAEFCSPNFDFLNLISPESKDTVRSAFEKHMKGEEVEPYEYTLITKDGRKLDVIITTKLIQ